MLVYYSGSGDWRDGDVKSTSSMNLHSSEESGLFVLPEQNQAEIELHGKTIAPKLLPAYQHENGVTLKTHKEENKYYFYIGKFSGTPGNSEHCTFTYSDVITLPKQVDSERKLLNSLPEHWSLFLQAETSTLLHMAYICAGLSTDDTGVSLYPYLLSDSTLFGDIDRSTEKGKQLVVAKKVKMSLEVAGLSVSPYDKPQKKYCILTMVSILVRTGNIEGIPENLLNHYFDSPNTNRKPDKKQEEVTAIGFIRRKDLINLIELSKVFALHHETTAAEAAHWVATKASTELLTIYNLIGCGIPETFPQDKSSHIALNVVNLPWWKDSILETAAMPGGGGACLNDVAILKTDAQKLLGLSEKLIGDLLPKVKNNELEKPILTIAKEPLKTKPQSTLDELKSWQEFKQKAENVINQYPEWKNKQNRKIQKSHLEDFINPITTNKREIEIIKRFVSEKFNL